MQSQMITIARMQALKANDAEPSIYMNRAVVEAFNLSNNVMGSIASFSIEGFTFRVRIAEILDDSAECIMYFSDAALRLMRIKVNANYMVTYHPFDRRFAFGYRKNIKPVSFVPDAVNRSVSLLDWYGTENSLAPARFGIRLLALAVDAAILCLCFAALLNAFSFIASLIMGVLVSWLYFAVLESSWIQATIGKFLLGMRVTDLYQRRISFVTASGRFFARIITPVSLIVNVIAPRSQFRHAFHDLVTGCAVVKRQRQFFK